MTNEKPYHYEPQPETVAEIKAEESSEEVLKPKPEIKTVEEFLKPKPEPKPEPKKKAEFQQIKSSFNMKELVEESKKLEYTIDAGNVYMAVVSKPESKLWQAAEELAKFRAQRVLRIYVHKLVQKTETPKHRDWLPATANQGNSPCLERWHLPTQTNDEAVWWDEKSGETHLPEGIWSGPVPYWILHSIMNRGDTERIHIIVDLDSPTALGRYEY